MEVASSKILNERPEVASSSRPLLVGIITGQIAGLIMAVIIMIVFTLFLGKGPFYPVQVIGSILLGETALNGFSAVALLVGLILHQLGPSLLWGVAFGFVAQRFPIISIRQSLLIGLLLGAVSMIGPYLLIPSLSRALHGVDIWNREVPLMWDWAAHLIFGASFALYPLVQRKMNK